MKEFVFAQAAIAGGSLQRNDLIEEIVGEAAIMSFLQHPRILHLYGCSLTSQVSNTYGFDHGNPDGVQGIYVSE